ncbi:MAG: TonB-dependent receptor [Caulobacter sp.]|nr:TonB-dependent receptor [Caulobacter sp.]
MDQPPPPAPPPTPVAAVEIRAATLPPSPSDAVFSIVRVTPEALEQNPRLDEALATVPGVSLFRRTSSLGANPTTQGLSLRGIAGSGAGRALVTLDGAPQNDPFGGWVIWSALPSEAIGGAQVVRGAGAGPYGAGALTGVVALTGGHASGLSASIGELGQSRVALTWDHRTGGGNDLFLAASGGHSDGWTPVRTGAGAADQPLTLDYANAQARLTGDLGPATGQVTLSGYREARGSGLAGAASRAQGGELAFAIAQQPAPNAIGWRMGAWVSASDLRNTSVAVAAGRATTTPANAQDSTPATGYGANAALRWTGGDWTWEAGADARAAKGETRERFRFIGGTFTRNRVAGGANLDLGLYGEGAYANGPWTVGLGARLDRWSTSDGKRLERDLATNAITLDVRPGDRSGLLPTGRAGVRYQTGNGLYWRAASYAGFRPPTLNELHRPFRVGNDITEANPTLKPERLYGVEAGVGGQGGATAWSLTLFANRLSDPVTNVTVGIGPFTDPVAGLIPAGGVLRQRRNAGRVDAWGLEGETSYRASDALTLRGAVSYTHARVDGQAAAPQLTGLRPAETPELTVTAGIDWRIAGPLTLHADLRGESVRYDDDLNSRRLGPSVSLDAEADWQVTDKALLYIAVDNLGDADVETGRTADGIVSYGPPRTARVGARLRF